MSFLDAGELKAQIYRDGKNAEYDTKPYGLVIEKHVVKASDTMTFSPGRSGGAAMRFVKQ